MTDALHARAAVALPRRRPWAGYLLGFGMGGFFDGILLHQILQWHHLLSGLSAATLADLRVQVVADGVFHALMYAVAGAGLWSLYRSRGASQPSRKTLLAHFLLGFGIWHVVDAVLSHWLIGIHRLRMDVPDPLPWELAWLALFGLLQRVASGCWPTPRPCRYAPCMARARCMSAAPRRRAGVRPGCGPPSP